VVGRFCDEHSFLGGLQALAQNTVFEQIIKLIPRTIFQAMVARHDADKGLRTRVLHVDMSRRIYTLFWVRDYRGSSKMGAFERLHSFFVCFFFQQSS